MTVFSTEPQVTPAQIIDNWELEFYELACILRKSETHIRRYVQNGKVPESMLLLCTKLDKEWREKGYVEILIRKRAKNS